MKQRQQLQESSALLVLNATVNSDAFHFAATVHAHSTHYFHIELVFSNETFMLTDVKCNKYRLQWGGTRYL